MVFFIHQEKEREKCKCRELDCSDERGRDPDGSAAFPVALQEMKDSDDQIDRQQEQKQQKRCGGDRCPAFCVGLKQLEKSRSDSGEAGKQHRRRSRPPAGEIPAEEAGNY